MKILLCHNNYTKRGGAEVFYHEVGRVLSANGHEVAYFSVADECLEIPWRDYFPHVVQHNHGNFFARVRRFPNLIYNYNAKSAMKRIINDFKPDIVHVFAIYIQLTPSILDAARQAKIPVVMSCNDYKLICPNYKLYHHNHICEECRGHNFYRAVVNRCCHNSVIYSVASSIEAYTHHWLNIYRKNIHTFLFASEFMAQKTEEFWGAETFRWQILRNPFDASTHKMSTASGDYLLYFGRLIDEKGVQLLLEAAAMVPEVPLVVVGDGPDLHQLQKQTRLNKLDQVRFAGPLWGADLDEVLRNCRGVVVPSLWHENFPYVILQAFAVGKPVIGSNRGGIPELVKHGERGLIFDADKVENLAKSMKQFMTDEILTRNMGIAAKHYVDKEFNDERFYTRLMQIYSEVLS